MASDRWTRLAEWHNAWLMADATERNQLVERLAERDPDLYSDAQKLLEGSDVLAGFLETPAFVLAAPELAAEEPSLAADTMFGPYRIIGLRARGGMGDVYRATDVRLHRDVALKTISQRLVASGSSRKRFEVEARAASALNHPAIVTIYDVGETAGMSWIAMEWVEGRTLREVLSEGPVPIHDAWSLAKQVADGLAAAHGKGIVHRDLKPENVMVTPAGRAKILDFGLARRTVVDLPNEASPRADTRSAAATFAGAILGTVGYMSPEQAAGRVADFRSDQFSLGVVVYELLTGERAFVRPTAVETLSAIIREDPRPVATLRRGVSAAFQRAVEQCLAKRPEDRFASTTDLVATLDTLEPEGDTHPAAMLGGEDHDTAAHAGRRLRQPGLVLGGAAAVVVAITLTALNWNRPTPVLRPPIQSLAVLPFENSADDPETEYVGDGLTEGLIDRLSRVPSLKVMARATVMRFKGLGDPLQAGKSLGVGAVLTGTFVRRDRQIVISAELIDPISGERLWGQAYDRPYGELLQVGDRIASEIVDGLRLRLSQQERDELGGYGTQNREAYELFMRGRFLMASDTEEDDLEAQRMFLQAIDKDPRFVEAHLQAGATYARSAGEGYAPPRQALAEAFEHVQHALAIDAADVRVRAAAVAIGFQRDRDWQKADREFRAVIDDPKLFLGNQYQPIAAFFVARGQPDEAVALLERALALDPGNLQSRNMLGSILMHAGRLDEAVNIFNAIIATAPDDPRPHFGLADLYHRRGDVAQAIAARRQAYQLAGDRSAADAFAKARTEADYARAEIAVARRRLQLLQELAKERYVSPLDLARLHAQAGQRDQALAALEEALRDPPNGMTMLKADPAWDSLRAEPRFAAIVRQVGIP